MTAQDAYMLLASILQGCTHSVAGNLLPTVREVEEEVVAVLGQEGLPWRHPPHAEVPLLQGSSADISRQQPTTRGKDSRM
jgi:hypothetical protein